MSFVVLLLAGCVVTGFVGGLLPGRLLQVAAVALLVYAIYRARNSSLA